MNRSTLRFVMPTIGLILSMYALYVETKVHDGAEDFTALCDIEFLGASCSKVFALPEGRLLSYLRLVHTNHILDIPNAALGCMYYVAYLALHTIRSKEYILISMGLDMVVVLAFWSTIFLAITLTRIHELCVLCWTTHVINTWLCYDRIFSKKRRSQQKGSSTVRKNE
jgi:uncharacterized membrane protein